MSRAPYMQLNTPTGQSHQYMDLDYNQQQLRASTSTSTNRNTSSEQQVAAAPGPSRPKEEPYIPDYDLSLHKSPTLKGHLKKGVLKVASQVAPDAKLDQDAAELLLYVTNDFLNSLANFSCRLATHRSTGDGGEVQVLPQDVELFLEQIAGMPVLLNQPIYNVPSGTGDDDDEEGADEPATPQNTNIGERLRTRHARSASTASQALSHPQSLARTRTRRRTNTVSMVEAPSASDNDDEDDEDEDDEDDEEGDEEEGEGGEGGNGDEGEDDDEEEEEDGEEIQPRESKRLKERAQAERRGRGRGRGRGRRR